MTAGHFFPSHEGITQKTGAEEHHHLWRFVITLAAVRPAATVAEDCPAARLRSR
ncbi:hypothetical protein [Glycomyces sp. NRRL B-16210]|uniref:hypothetical protein n=1 Tax=Glycomyces sp. NRRL B-16210 TaxID=1463821 RepID=UPI000AF55A94|nr:hypothetical protein [Glycomyces sp. NRRL B-16210]